MTAKKFKYMWDDGVMRTQVPPQTFRELNKSRKMGAKKYLAQNKGWVGESTRHSMASYGIKTGRKSSVSTKTYKMPKMMVEKPKKNNLLLSYSDSDNYDSEKENIKEQLKEEGVYPEDFDAELEKRLNNADYSMYWDDFKENLTAELKAKNPDGYWFVEGEHLNWRNSSGEKYIQANTGEELLEKIAPNTNDYSVDVFRNGAGLSMRIYHHDVPMGSLYILHKVSKKEFDKHNEE